MALVTIQRSPTISEQSLQDDESSVISGVNHSINVVRPRSFSEHYFAINGAALVLPKNECLVTKAVTGSAAHLQQHLQQMFSILRPEDRITLAVKLESGFPNHIRYLVIVSCIGRQDTEESAILGFDFSSSEVTIGMILPIFADMNITLDGDGGFKLTSDDRRHIFKPVSVQAMWSAYQSLHKASTQARLFNYMAGGLTHTWIEFYRSLNLQSNQMCINEWFQMDEILSHRSDSPHLFQTLSSDEEMFRQHIHVKLKEIMLMVDLDEVTSKFLREQLEKSFQMNLSSYKQYIDDVMLQILAQMDKPTMILSHLYLGSEWNASNFEELKANNVGYILNVSREIDNFFPGQFKYLNVRVHDNDEADLLKEWEKTYRFINEAKTNNQACLVHCKMGISRSASTVLAYLMKENSHTLNDALDHVKKRRSCINPNGGFRSQLQVYEGILAANKTFRSKLGDITKKPSLTVSNSDNNVISISTITVPTTSIIREPSPTNTVTILAQEKFESDYTNELGSLYLIERLLQSYDHYNSTEVESDVLLVPPSPPLQVVDTNRHELHSEDSQQLQIDNEKRTGKPLIRTLKDDNFWIRTPLEDEIQLQYGDNENNVVKFRHSKSVEHKEEQVSPSLSTATSSNSSCSICSTNKRKTIFLSDDNIDKKRANSDGSSSRSSESVVLSNHPQNLDTSQKHDEEVTVEQCKKSEENEMITSDKVYNSNDDDEHYWLMRTSSMRTPKKKLNTSLTVGGVSRCSSLKDEKRCISPRTNSRNENNTNTSSQRHSIDIENQKSLRRSRKVHLITQDFERKPSLLTLPSNNTAANVVTGSTTDIFKREGIEIKDGLVRSQVKMFNAGPSTPPTTLCLLLTDCDEMRLNYNDSNNVNDNIPNMCEETTTVVNSTSVIKDEKTNEKSPSSGYGSLDFPIIQTEKNPDNIDDNENCSPYKLRNDHDRNLYIDNDLNKHQENSKIITRKNDCQLNKLQSQQSFMSFVTNFNSDKTSTIELLPTVSKSNDKISKRPLSYNGYVQTAAISSMNATNKSNRNKKVFDHAYRNQPVDYSVTVNIEGKGEDVNVVQDRPHPIPKIRQHLSML